MPRERKRPDWDIQTFKYHVEPQAEIPQALWDLARQKQNVWNELVALREEYLARYLPQRETMDSEAKRAFWNEFQTNARAVVNAAGLYWAEAGDVLDRFFTAHRAAFKQERGAPRKRFGLERVRIVHRFTAGGWGIARITGRAERFAFAFLPNARHYEFNVHAALRARLANARFRVGAASIPLRVNLHRQLPRTGFIKQVALCGEFDKLARKWTWHIIITTETEPRPAAPRSPHHAGLDLGWRKMRDERAETDYIRIGFLYDDSENEIELRLPLDFSTAQARQQGYPCSHAELAELAASIALDLESAKAQLREFGVTPPALTQMRQGGLKKFLHELETRVDELMPQEFRALEMLREWKHQNDRLQTRYNKSAARFAARRRWLYQNLAAWLTKNYGVISWEGNLSVKEMAEAEIDDDDYALKASMTQRQIASIGEFREILKHAASKNGAALFGAEMARTTTECFCGAEAEAGAELYLVCANGHRFDQDANAARNLFSQIPPAIDTETDLRENGDGTPQIPAELRTVAVYVHSTK